MVDSRLKNKGGRGLDRATYLREAFFVLVGAMLVYKAIPTMVNFLEQPQEVLPYGAIIAVGALLLFLVGRYLFPRNMDGIAALMKRSRDQIERGKLRKAKSSYKRLSRAYRRLSHRDEAPALYRHIKEIFTKLEKAINEKALADATARVDKIKSSIEKGRFLFAAGYYEELRQLKSQLDDLVSTKTRAKIHTITEETHLFYQKAVENKAVVDHDNFITSLHNKLKLHTNKATTSAYARASAAYTKLSKVAPEKTQKQAFRDVQSHFASVKQAEIDKFLAPIDKNIARIHKLLEKNRFFTAALYYKLLHRHYKKLASHNQEAAEKIFKNIHSTQKALTTQRTLAATTKIDKKKAKVFAHYNNLLTSCLKARTASLAQKTYRQLHNHSKRVHKLAVKDHSIQVHKDLRKAYRHVIKTYEQRCIATVSKYLTLARKHLKNDYRLLAKLFYRISHRNYHKIHGNSHVSNKTKKFLHAELDSIYSHIKNADLRAIHKKHHAPLRALENIFKHCQHLISSGKAKAAGRAYRRAATAYAQLSKVHLHKATRTKAYNTLQELYKAYHALLARTHEQQFMKGISHLKSLITKKKFFRASLTYRWLQSKYLAAGKLHYITESSKRKIFQALTQQHAHYDHKITEIKAQRAQHRREVKEARALRRKQRITARKQRIAARILLKQQKLAASLRHKRQILNKRLHLEQQRLEAIQTRKEARLLRKQHRISARHKFYTGELEQSISALRRSITKGRFFRASLKTSWIRIKSSLAVNLHLIARHAGKDLARDLRAQQRHLVSKKLQLQATRRARRKQIKEARILLRQQKLAASLRHKRQILNKRLHLEQQRLEAKQARKEARLLRKQHRISARHKFYTDELEKSISTLRRNITATEFWRASLRQRWIKLKCSLAISLGLIAHHAGKDLAKELRGQLNHLITKKAQVASELRSLRKQRIAEKILRRKQKLHKKALLKKLRIEAKLLHKQQALVLKQKKAAERRNIHTTELTEGVGQLKRLLTTNKFIRAYLARIVLKTKYSVAKVLHLVSPHNLKVAARGISTQGAHLFHKLSAISKEKARVEAERIAIKSAKIAKQQRLIKQQEKLIETVSTPKAAAFSLPDWKALNIELPTIQPKYVATFMVMLLLIGGGLMLTSQESITGYTVYEEKSQLLSLNATFNSSDELTLEQLTNITSLSLTGTLLGDGSAKVYLEHNRTRTLVLELGTDSGEDIEVPSVPGPPIIALPGSSDETDSEPAEKQITTKLTYKEDSPYDTDNNGVTSTKDIIDLTVESTEFNWNVTEQNICTEWEVIDELSGESTLFCTGSAACCSLVDLAPTTEQWNEPLYLYKGLYDSTESNTIAARVLYADIEVSLDSPTADIISSEWQSLTASFENKATTFVEECQESCLMDPLTEPINLIVELDAAELEIDSLSFTSRIPKTILTFPPSFTKEIPTIKLNPGQNISLDLTQFITDRDTEVLNYSYQPTDHTTITFENNTAYIASVDNFTGIEFTFFLANDSSASTTSNLVTIEIVDPLQAVESTAQISGVVLNQPVRWSKSVILDRLDDNVSIVLDSDVSNITVISIEDNSPYLVPESNIKIDYDDKTYSLEDYEIEKQVEDIDDDIQELILRKQQNIPNNDLVRETNRQIIGLVEQRDLITGAVILDSGSKGYITRFMEWLFVQFNADVTGAIVGLQSAFEDTPEELPQNTTLIVESPVEELVIEYYTPGPTAEETLTENGKQIVISSDIHYENITAYTTIPENSQNRVSLYHIVNNTRIPTDIVHYKDTNNNSLVDTIYWIVPHLSNQTYEIDLNILNIQSYPEVGHNWTVNFEVAGTSNLTITAYNGTTFTETYNDNFATIDDLQTRELACGPTVYYERQGQYAHNDTRFVLSNGSEFTYEQIANATLLITAIKVIDFSCNITANHTVKVLTEHDHHQNYTFGTISLQAHNDAAGTNCNTPASGSQCNMDTYGAEDTCIDTSGDNTIDTSDYCHNVGTNTECSSHIGASCSYNTGYGDTDGICVDSGTCSDMPVSGEVGTGLTSGTAVNFHDGDEKEMCMDDEELMFCVSSMSGHDPTADGICADSACATTSPVVALDCTDQDCAVSDISAAKVVDCTSSCTSAEHGFACDSSTTSSGWVQDGMYTFDSADTQMDTCVTTGYVCYSTGFAMYYNSHDGGVTACDTDDACDETLTDGNFDSEYGTLDSGGDCISSGGNTAPTLNAVVINSTSGLNKTSGDIQCWVNATDADADTINAYVRWFNQSVEWAHYTDKRVAAITDGAFTLLDTINASALTKNENWTAMIQIDDGTVNASDWVNASLVVRNSPQNASGQIINASRLLNKSDEDITFWLRLTDLDNETEFTVNYRWFTDGVEDTDVSGTVNISLDTLTNITLQSGNTSSLENWTIMVNHYDGDFNSSFENYSLVIKDSTPPGINFSDNTPGNDSTLTVAYAELNISINETNLANLSFYWNNTNYTIYNDSLILMMNFDNRSELGENNTFFKDLSTYNHNGNGTAFDHNEIVDAKYGQGIDFDGTNDYIDLGAKSLGTSPITISGWFNADASQTKGLFSLLTGVGMIGYYGSTDNGGLSTMFGFRGEHEMASPSSSLTAGVWQHITYVYNGADDDLVTSYAIYINGVNQTVSRRGGTIGGSTTNNYIGREQAASYYNGKIDELQIWNRSLTPEEILQLYQSSLTKLNTTHWQLFTNQTINEDESYNYSATAADLSGNSNQTEMRTLSGPAGNTAPTITEVILNATNTNNRTTHNLTAWVKATDSDSDTITAYVRWFNDSVEWIDHTDIRTTPMTDGEFTLIDVIYFPNTTKYENWTAMVQIDDGTVNATAFINSTQLNISNTPGEITPTYPLNNTDVTNRTTHFNWSAGDVDNDTLTFDIIISRQSCGDQNSRCITDEIEANDVSGASYEISEILDLDSRYNWTVNVSDGVETVESDRFNFTLTSLLSLTFVNGTVDFGTLNPGIINDTTNDSPTPFNIENSGNTMVNITVNATALWKSPSAALPSEYWQFKVDNSSETVSFNWTESQTTWMNVSDAELHVIRQLNWTDAYDSAEIDINITVPEDEHGSAHTGTMTYTARWWTNATG